MIICGYDITLSDATVLLAFFTAVSVFFTAKAARHTKELAQYNKELVAQSEKQHREALRPLCVPTSATNDVIADFREVLGSYCNIVHDGNHATTINGNPTIHLHFVNKGLGPAVNVRFHINDIHYQRITKDFMVAHALPPGEMCRFLSEIAMLNIRDGSGNLFLGMSPQQVLDDAYFIVCEYESLFSADAYHSIVAKGYREPALAGDGENPYRLSRPLTPPVEFKPGLDAAKPIWPIPPDDADYPAEFLNFPSQP